MLASKTRPRSATLVLGLLCACLSGKSPATQFEPYRQSIDGYDLDIAMVPVSGGTFTMGSPDNEPGRSAAEGPQHTVTVDDFWMAQYETSWEQYDLFVERDEHFARLSAPESLSGLAIDGVTGATAPYMDMSMGMGKDGYPAINMTQYAALRYARWLSAKTGHFYRLPTEAEWEYACRAGTGTPWSFGADPGKSDTYAVHKGNSAGRYAPVGSREPNHWQLYDMHGNVAEWTMDQFDAGYYAASGQDNPWHRPVTLYPRTARGGSWMHDISEARCAARMASDSAWKDFDPQIPRSRWWHTSAPFVGFRLVRPRTQPSPEAIEAYWLDAIEDYGS